MDNRRPWDQPWHVICNRGEHERAFVNGFEDKAVAEADAAARTARASRLNTPGYKVVPNPD